MLRPSCLVALIAAAAPAGAAQSAVAVAPPVAQVDAFRFESVEQADRVETDGTQVRTVALRVRLGNAQGVATFGQIAQPYVDGYHQVAFEDVEIQKPDGRHVAVKNGLVEDLNPFGVTGSSTPADVRYKRLTIPGLEPGDVLGYRIVIRRKPLSPGRTFGDIKLPAVPGGTVQTYVLDLPRRSDIRVRLREGLGASWEEVPAEPDRLVRRLRLKVDPPPEKATKKDRESWVEPDVMFSNFGSWADVTGWWWALSKSRLQSSDAIAREAARLVAGATTPAAKVAALHAFVAQRVRYLNVSFGLGRMQPRPAADVLENLFGDCKDKHALLGALASSVGLDVRPVLVDSSRPDLRDDVPGPQQFDHMISVVRLGPSTADWLWLDTTNPFTGPGYLSPGLRDKRALLVEPDGGASLVRTPKDLPFVPRREMTFKGQLAPDGDLRGRVTLLVRADSEPALRAVFAAVPQERRASAVKEVVASQMGEVAVENVTVSDPLDVSSAFRIEFDAVCKPKAGAQSLWIPVVDVGLSEADPAATGDIAAKSMYREILARGRWSCRRGCRHAPRCRSHWSGPSARSARRTRSRGGSSRSSAVSP
jgi:transglutaminase-like putative cysteine protease